MNLERLPSGLLIPHHEPTYEEKRAAALDAYYTLHEVCPECGGEKGEQTCMGFIWSEGALFADPNHTHCTECKWRGTIDDLVPKGFDRISINVKRSWHRADSEEDSES